MRVDRADLEDRDVADRHPDIIKQEIDVAREQFAATVDSLAKRANPIRLADELKARVIEFVKRPAVIAALVSCGALIVIVVVLRGKNR